MEGVSKSFPGVHAVKDCPFDLYAGEVHALVGENGAGKSTLVKILAGVHRKDSGKVLIKGKEASLGDTRSAINASIAMIHQELQLVPHLTAAMNIFIGREHRKRIKFVIDDKKSISEAGKIIERMKVNLNPTARVMDLSIAEQYMVEIAKAISQNASILILDEPTAALTDTETQTLFGLIREMKSQGMGIIYISHRMEELKQIADRITVMRDGNYIGTKNIEDITVNEIVNMMVGRTIYETTPELPEHPSEETVLEVKNLNCGSKIRDVSFKLRKGEILGFPGLIGAGRTEVARAIFGADPYDSGEIYISGKKVNIKHPLDAVKHGIGYLSEDRKRYGLALARDIETNMMLASYKNFAKAKLIVNSNKINQTAKNTVSELNIATPSIQQLIRNLSGGNQQKVVIAKWLIRNSDILIFDEPTRGIDVGAKSEIYKLLNNLARQGKSIIMISSELPEILRMSHRVIVMCEGRITGELNAGEATQEKIMHLATMRINN
ncbi:MAG: sugar ABC transporter ATP-binding protein [Treponema sp.]|jgi:ribose transport system ATP-binding protein|nr:sugar ABC transporter ATP-binding protein [Treponema sp.]